MELHKRRKALSEPEVRYFMHQILLAVQHLHDVKVSKNEVSVQFIFVPRHCVSD